MTDLIQRVPLLGKSQVIQRGAELWQSRSQAMRFVIGAIAANFVYWAVIASDRYVSEAHVVVERTDFAISGGNLTSLINGGPAVAALFDVIILQDHLQSPDMLNALDKELDLRSHYADWRRDPLSRMLLRETSQENFVKYMGDRISIAPDPNSGILTIKVQAFSPKMAHDISTMMVKEGDRFINEMAHRLARDQVAFVEKELADRRTKLRAARNAAVAFQNKHHLISPTSAAATLTGVTAEMESKLAELRAQRSGLLGYLAPTAPEVTQIEIQIRGLEQQLESEKKRLAAPNGTALNRVVEQYQQLELAAKFEEEAYVSALKALQEAHVQATRNIKKISIVAAPSMPESAVEPERIRNIIVGTLIVLTLAGIAQLFSLIIRDHMD